MSFRGAVIMAPNTCYVDSASDVGYGYVSEGRTRKFKILRHRDTISKGSIISVEYLDYYINYV